METFIILLNIKILNVPKDKTLRYLNKILIISYQMNKRVELSENKPHNKFSK
jgi:hypothetical protein